MPGSHAISQVAAFELIFAEAGPQRYGPRPSGKPWVGHPGEIINIVHGTESDRATLLAVLAGRAVCQQASLSIAGRSLAALPRLAQRELRRTLIGSVLRNDGPGELFTVLELAALPLLAQSLPLDEAMKRASIELQRFGLLAWADMSTRSLSEGLRRLACLAAAVVHRPRLLVVDQPELHLNDDQIMDVYRCLSAVAADGSCVVISTTAPELATVPVKRCSLTELLAPSA